MARLVLNHLSDSTYRQLSIEASRRNVNVSELAVILLELAVADLAAGKSAQHSPLCPKDPNE